jgi:phage tail tape-measure protein
VVGPAGCRANYVADLGVGYAGGEAQTFIESATAPGLTRALSSAGFSDPAAGFGGKLGGSMGAAFIVAPAVTGLQMWFSDQKYTTADYEAKMTRSAVSAGGGAVAGALAAGAYGALAGSEAPLVGNAIGFVVGFGGYLLTDWLVGDPVEEEVRDLAGEKGCTDGIGPRDWLGLRP